jgi:hypothetical protein
MFGLRLLRRAGALVALLIAAAIGFVLWALLWPAPGHAPNISCVQVVPKYRKSCVRITGRVLYHTAFGRGHRAHVVLLSQQSVTLPAISSLEFPRLAFQPGGLGLGDWVTVIGRRTVGSHHEHDVHVNGFATSAMTVKCGKPGAHEPCVRLTPPTGPLPGSQS